MLLAYPLERLGMWSFVLVPSYKWKDLVRVLGGSTDSPAFTIFERRTTVMARRRILRRFRPMAGTYRFRGCFAHKSDLWLVQRKVYFSVQFAG